MNRNSNTTKIFWGLILIVLGMAFLADQYSAFSFGRIIGYLWPLILVAFGVLALMRSSYSNRGGWVLVGLGLIFFVGQFVSFNIWNLWPLILVFIGLSMLFGWNENKMHEKMMEESSEDRVDHTIVFWGLEKKVLSQNFKGGEITAIFGGVKMDLSQAKLAEGAKLDVTAIFGGVELRVAPEIHVVNNGTGIFGGFSSRNSSNPDAGQKLVLTGTAVFGGVEAKS